jgi:FMN phosphatase YigB (HAD superfamily)
MGIELVVLDFDGTLTNVDIEAIPFVEGFKNDLSNVLKINRLELDSSWNKVQSLMESNPSAYGWIINGMMIAPAYADPLVMSTAIAQILFKDFGFNDEQNISKTLDTLFQNNYGKSDISFKEDADSFLTDLKKNIPCCIITNSKTDNVIKKISKLPSTHSDIPVFGDAKKYIVNPDWQTTFSSEVSKFGFNRPLFTRRQKYYEKLKNILETNAVPAEKVVVVGDIYELDLLLPEMIGMHTILAPREKTPLFEIKAVQDSPKGYVTKSLTDALKYILQK